ALKLLVELMPASAHKVMGEGIHDIAIKDINNGDKLLIKPGEKIPADGRIIEGTTYVNESMLTGESTPVERSVNQKAIGGSINQNGSITIEVEATGKDSYLSKVIGLVEQAKKSKSATQQIADKAALWLTIIALATGFSTLSVWLGFGKSFAFSLERMVTVMVISCPHALGLAIPLVVAISVSLSAKNGLLIRNRTAFENSRKITCIVFDKTGTLTKGSFGVTDICSLNNQYNADELLRLASGIEQQSEHPISAGILKKATESKTTIPAVKGFKALPGHGVEGTIENKPVKVVGPEYLQENNIKYPVSKNNNGTTVFVIIDQVLAGYIILSDEIRQESYQAIKTLRDMHIKTFLLTGDNERVAESVSNELHMN